MGEAHNTNEDVAVVVVEEKQEEMDAHYFIDGKARGKITTSKTKT
jgi:hypothetical protein